MASRVGTYKYTCTQGPPPTADFPIPCNIDAVITTSTLSIAATGTSRGKMHHAPSYISLRSPADWSSRNKTTRGRDRAGRPMVQYRKPSLSQQVVSTSVELAVVAVVLTMTHRFPLSACRPSPPRLGAALRTTRIRCHSTIRRNLPGANGRRIRRPRRGFRRGRCTPECHRGTGEGADCAGVSTAAGEVREVLAVLP